MIALSRHRLDHSINEQLVLDNNIGVHGQDMAVLRTHQSTDEMEKASAQRIEAPKIRQLNWLSESPPMVVMRQILKEPGFQREGTCNYWSPAE